MMRITFFPILFTLGFLLVLGIFIFAFVQSLRQWNKNNHSPRLTVDAMVTDKREDVTAHHQAQTHAVTHSTSYFVTFQVESGDRLELCLSGQDYGLLAPGDVGRLTFQGTRYLGFEIA